MPGVVGGSFNTGTGSGKKQRLGGRTMPGKFVVCGSIKRVVPADLHARRADDKVRHGALYFHPAREVGDKSPFGGIVVDPGDGIIAPRREVTVPFVVIGIKLHGSAQSAEVVLTGGAFGTIPGLRQSGQEHGRKNSDDGNDDQQFDQRKVSDDRCGGKFALKRSGFKVM